MEAEMKKKYKEYDGNWENLEALSENITLGKKEPISLNDFNLFPLVYVHKTFKPLERILLAFQKITHDFTLELKFPNEDFNMHMLATLLFKFLPKLHHLTKLWINARGPTICSLEDLRKIWESLSQPFSRFCF